MITGAHAILYSRDAAADRAFLRDILRLRHVDVGEGWLIFALPPSEMAVHPHGKNDVHELYLLCDDVASFREEMAARGVACSPVDDRGWGLLTEVTLPGGGKLGVYEPRHAQPKAPSARRAAKKKPAAKKPAKKKPAKAASSRRRR